MRGVIEEKTSRIIEVIIASVRPGELMLGKIYITKYDSFMKSKCRVSGNIGLYVMSEEMSVDIDTTFDMLLVKSIMEKKIEKNN